MDHFSLSSQARELSLVRRQSTSPIGAPAPYGFEELENASEGKGILDYWRILVRRKKVILLCGLLGILLGLGAGVPMRPVFRAHAQLELLNLNEDFMNLKQSDPLTTNGGSTDTSEQETQVRVLESDALRLRTFAKLDPAHPLPWGKSHLAVSGWKSWFHLSQPAKITPWQGLLYDTASRMKVRAAAKTRILEVTTDSYDPQLAADFTNTLIAEYMQQSIESRWSAVQKTNEWLSHEIEEARQTLQRSEDSLQNYARLSGLIFTSDNTNLATEKLQEVQHDLSAATADRIAKQSRYELARTTQPDSLADVLGDAGLQAATAKLNDANRELANLSAIYDPEFSKVQRVRAEVEDLQKVVRTDRSNIVKRIENDYQEAARRESLMIGVYNARTQEVIGQGEKAIQYNILKREVDSNRQIYETMLQQMKQSSISSALRASNVRVLDRADVPDWPISPNPKLNMLLGLIAGLVISAFVVLLVDDSSRVLQNPGELKKWTSVPELGTIPTAFSNGVSLLAIPSAGLKALTTRNANRDNVMKEGSSRKVADYFRSTLTSILFVGDTEARPQVLVVTSPNAGEGKTTVASNLAMTVAEIASRVLIIDADLRRPRMHQIYNIPNQSGLSTYLSNKHSDISPASLIVETEIPGLDVLPSGPPTDSAGALLFSPRFGLLLTKLRSYYDMILIDTPPMLQMTDARLAGRLADAVILVTRAGQTTGESVTVATARFAEDQTRVIGTILNDWNPQEAPKRHYLTPNYYLTNNDEEINVEPSKG